MITYKVVEERGGVHFANKLSSMENAGWILVPNSFQCISTDPRANVGFNPDDVRYVALVSITNVVEQPTV